MQSSFNKTTSNKNRKKKKRGLNNTKGAFVLLSKFEDRRLALKFEN